MFGKGKITDQPKEEVAPKTRPVTKVQVNLRNGYQWIWTFKEENRDDIARKLYDKFTGEPDEQGWIRSIEDEWAYKPSEILGVQLKYGDTEEVEE